MINDGSGRFKAGEIGELVDHDFEKYDYCVKFPDGRKYYFYKGEIEIFKKSK